MKYYLIRYHKNFNKYMQTISHKNQKIFKVKVYRFEIFLKEFISFLINDSKKSRVYYLYLWLIFQKNSNLAQCKKTSVEINIFTYLQINIIQISNFCSCTVTKHEILSSRGKQLWNYPWNKETDLTKKIHSLPS